MFEAQPEQGRQDVPERLLERYLAGDADAFEALVGLYEDKLYGFILRMVGDAHLAEDVFQQVFMKVATHAATFDGRASFSTWVYRIARNAAQDELRRKRRRRVASVADPDGGGMENIFASNEPTPLEKLAADELAEKIRQALDEIPPAQRAAFLLKEEAEMDFTEIGMVMGCGKETAKSRFRLAVGKLRQALGMEGAAP